MIDQPAIRASASAEERIRHLEIDVSAHVETQKACDDEIRRLRDALRGVALWSPWTDGVPCWCVRPNGGHGADCRAARRALSGSAGSPNAANAGREGR